MNRPGPRRFIPEGMAFSEWRARDGWPLRRFDWPAKGRPRGSLLFLGGRGDFVEKYLEALGHWHEAGWRLAGFDWRGQGGSGRYLADPLICHIPDFDPLLADLAAFLADWDAPSPRLLVAHSMGAQLAMRLLARGDAGIAGAVLLAPMVGIGIKGLPTAFAHIAAKGAIALGRAERRIWEKDLGNYGGRMTSCPERQEDKIWWKAHQPETASGAPSWGWLAAACASIAALKDPGAIKLPALILAAKRDPVIDIKAVRRAAARMPDAELHLLDGKGHELLREADAKRLPVLATIDAFLSRFG